MQACNMLVCVRSPAIMMISAASLLMLAQTPQQSNMHRNFVLADRSMHTPLPGQARHRRALRNSGSGMVALDPTRKPAKQHVFI